MNLYNLLVFFVLLRIINSIILRTYFDPDEFWQSLEIAHQYIYGYGELTWEWSEKIRGFTYPGIFAILFKILSILGIDSPEVLVIAPKIIQSIFAGLGDYYFVLLSQKWFGKEISKWAVLCYLTNWFTLYCITRTYSNSLETTLTIIYLYYWPWKGESRNESSRFKALWLASITFLVRPTNIVLSALLGLKYLTEIPIKELWSLLKQIVIVGSFCVGASIIIDFMFYKQITFVAWNFIEFNFISGGSSEYGVHPWHWYFSQGIPAMLASFLVPFIGSIYATNDRQYLFVFFGYIIVFSCLGHKEFRFIFPVLPIALIYCGQYLHFLYSRYSNSHMTFAKLKIRNILTIFLILMFSIQIGMAGYLSLIHQRGPIDTIDYIRSSNLTSVDFLLPCHSTPFYSHVHKPINMHYLQCPPTRLGIPDEQEIFFQDPLNFLEKFYSEKKLPNAFVFFDKLLPKIHHFLDENSYQQCKEIFHTHLSTREWVGHNIYIYCR